MSPQNHRRGLCPKKPDCFHLDLLMDDIAARQDHLLETPSSQQLEQSISHKQARQQSLNHRVDNYIALGNQLAVLLHSALGSKSSRSIKFP